MMSMTNWEYMLDRKIQLAICKRSDFDDLHFIAKPLFTARIINYKRPTKFRPPTLDPYNGTKDALNHVQSFKSYMIFFGSSNETICRSFPLAFKKHSMQLVLYLEAKLY